MGVPEEQDTEDTDKHLGNLHDGTREMDAVLPSCVRSGELSEEVRKLEGMCARWGELVCGRPGRGKKDRSRDRARVGG